MKETKQETVMALLMHNGELCQVPQSVMDVVNDIRDRWPELAVRFLDPSQHADLTDAPYIIVDTRNERVVLKVWELDQRVIEQLSLRDRNTWELMKLITLEEERQKKVKEDADQEERDEIKDKVLHTLRSPKGSYTVPTQDGKIVKVSDS